MEEILSKSTNRWLRAGVASVATTALVASGLTAFAGAASASEPVDFERIAGDNRYETSVEAAEAFGNTQDAILASGETGHYVDALSANFLAGVTTAPILLTRHDQLPASVKAHIESSNINEITIVGGELAVSASVEAELTAMGITVNRLEGQNRYRTNEAIIAAGAEESADTALIATGINFPDALGAGPVSYAGKHPVGITKTEDIPDYVVDALLAAGVDKAIIVGGELAVSDEVETELESKGIDVVTRLEGRNRAATSVAVAEFAVANLAGFDRGEMDFASGRELSEGIDALSGGPVSGREQTPILITVNEDRAPQLIEYLAANCEEVDDGDIYGGPLALSVALENQLEDAAQCDVTTNQDFTVAVGGEAATNEFGQERQYSFEVGDAEAVDIALVPAEDVTVDANGVASFTDTAGDANEADNLGNTTALITIVNGSNVTDDDYQGDIVPVNGIVNFTVEDTGAIEQVVPVVFADADNQGDLDLDADDQPTELFAVGGEKSWIPTESTTRTLTADELIDSVDKANDTIVTATAVYYYDANDRYYIDANNDDTAQATEEVTFAEFEAEVSADDELSAGTTYQSNEALSSAFLLEDLAPTAPAVTAASDTTDTSTVLTLTGVSADAEQVTVYCEVDGGTDPTPDADSDVCATATADADADLADFQVEVTGLQAGTTYDFAASQTVAGEESDLGTELENVTTAAEPVDRPTITDAQLTTDTVVEGLADGADVWELDFSEAMSVVADGDYFNLVDVDGDTFRVVCDNGGTIAADPTQGEATCNLTADDADGVANDLTITITTAPTDRNAAGDDALEYPATITAVVGLTDADGDNATVDLAASADVVVDDEA